MLSVTPILANVNPIACLTAIINRYANSWDNFLLHKSPVHLLFEQPNLVE
jgi:hypothetical protein